MNVNEIDWIDVEVKGLEGNLPHDFERHPSLAGKLQENKINSFVVDASKAWEKWMDNTNVNKPKIKVIVPCVFNGERCNWWLNTRNPVYKDLVYAVRDAQNKSSVPVRIMQTGSKENTKYIFVRD